MTGLFTILIGVVAILFIIINDRIDNNGKFGNGMSV